MDAEAQFALDWARTKAIGSIPAIIAKLVIKTARSRLKDPPKVPSQASPSSRPRFCEKSTSRIALAIATPIAMIAPMNDWILIVVCVAERIAWARQHAALAAENQLMLSASTRLARVLSIPSILLGFSTGGFGGGLGNQFGDWGGRYDIDALMTWELRNMGLGEQAVRTASDSYLKNLERIGQGQGLPIEVLQSAQAMETSERAYLSTVSNYNRAQLQLLWAMGWCGTDFGG